MDCFCGCGVKVPRKLTSVNLEASKVAVELLAWDKARTANPPAAPVTAETEQLIARGADCYQQLLATMHGEGGADPLPDCEDWLEESFEARKDRLDMVTKSSLLHRPKLNLADPDYERLDRKRPERSFSSQILKPGELTSPHGELVERLKELRDLHTAGALTDKESAEAKARVIGSRD